MNANIVDHGPASEMPQRSELGTPMPQRPQFALHLMRGGDETEVDVDGLARHIGGADGRR